MAAAGEAARMWSQVDPDRIARSWLALLPRLLTVLTGAQMAVADRADGYLDEVLSVQDVPAEAQGSVDVSALAGVASDGRALADLLYQPVIGTLSGIARGATVDRALAGGRAGLTMIVRTQVADAGRVADQVALTARPAATGYVRMLVGASCSRCAVLAGRWYRWDAGFARHPACDCVGVPAGDDTADEVMTDPKAYFASLPRDEQARVFTRAGADAIRSGADVAQVVNARGGVYTAGGRLFTRAGAGRRPRLMPEQILHEAGDDRAEAVRLLRLHGYLRGTPTARPPSRRDLDLAASTPAPVDFTATVREVERLVLDQGANLDAVVSRLRELGPGAQDALAAAQRAKDARRLVSTLRGMATRRAKADTPTATDTGGPALAKLTVVQLRALAKERGVRVPSRARKAEIVDLLGGGTAANAPAKAAKKTTVKKSAQAGGGFRQVPLTRLDQDRRDARRMLTFERARLRAATDPTERSRLQEQIRLLEDRATGKGALSGYTLESPYWSERSGRRVTGTPDATAVGAHAERVVTGSLPSDLRERFVAELRRQGESVPRSVLDLAAVRDLTQFDLAENGDALAYYRLAFRDITFHPSWSGGTSRAQVEQDCARSMASGWWTRRPEGMDAATGVMAHEFGHHVGQRVLDNASYAQLVTLARAFDDGLQAGGSIVKDVRRRGDFAAAVNDWLDAGLNRFGVTRSVSQYGSTNHHELMAEVWHEFSSMRDGARGHIRIMGEALRDLAEKMDVIH